MKTNYETLVDLVIKAETAGNLKHELLLDVCECTRVFLGVKVFAIVYGRQSLNSG